MKTIIKIFICLSLIYTPMFANAANVGGWNLSNAVAQGASTVFDASKNVVINGKNYIKDSWVKITPNASQVAKVLARGGAGYALSVAVEQLLGSVDWVLDPANNQIKYNVAVEGSGLYICSYGGVRNSSFMNCASVWESFNKPLTLSGCSELKQTCTATRPSDGYKFTVRPIVSAEVAPTNEERTYPLTPIAQQVINNAAAGDSSAQQAIVAAAQDIINEAETDQTKARPIVNQLEANAKTQTDESATAQAKPQADPVTGQQAPPIDITLEFPVFCSWAPIVCEAAQVVISFPQTLTGWWESANQKADDWATSISDAYRDFTKDDELPSDDTKVDITDIPTPELQENAISWGASCPADVSIPISMQGVSSTLVFSWSPWCQLLSIIKPAIIASAYIGAAFIVLGLRT